MANLIKISHRNSDEFAKSTNCNLFHENSLIEAEQMRKKNAENAYSGNGDSRSRDHVMQANKIKISALHYEIIERTKQLTQPRVRAAENEVSQKSLKSIIPKLMSRIFELACPKMIHDPPPKPVSFVSPNALRAIATQRIIELSQPRKNRCSDLPRRKMQMHRSCNLRIRGLCTSKQMDRLSAKGKRFETWEKDTLLLKKLLQGSSRSSSDAIYDARSTQKRFERKNKSGTSDKKTRRRESSRHYAIVSSTSSDRSVVDLKQKKHSRFSVSRKSRRS